METKASYGALSYIEHRSRTRHNTRLKATVQDAQHGTLAFMANGFSHRGTFLQRPDAATPLPAVGSVVRLLLHWPLQTETPPVHVAATVINQTTDGIGVRFELHA